MSTLLTFIKTNVWSIGLSSLVPALIWIVVGGGICLALLGIARRRGWLEGRLRTLLSLLLVLNLAFIVAPVMLVAGGGAAAARRAVVLYGESGSGNTSLDNVIHERLGMTILTPVVAQFIAEQPAAASATTLDGPTGLNLAPLADRTLAKRLIDTLEPEDLDNLLWHARRKLGAPKTKVPARAVVFMFNAAHSAFVESLDLFPDLLASLEVGPEGVLPAAIAQRQIGRRLLHAHGETLVNRAIGRRHFMLGSLAIAQFIGFLLLASAFAWASRPPTAG